MTTANFRNGTQSLGQASRMYRVGVDVGLYSVGLAAIEIDADDAKEQGVGVMYARPKAILSCLSVIHDAGLDSDFAKTSNTRKTVSGVARRSRRLRKQYGRRLRALDNTLTKLDEQKTYEPWQARIRLVNEHIRDEAERKALISLALRHITRHRG